MFFYNILSKIILFPTKEYFLLPCIAFLFHFYDKHVTARAAYLLLFTMVFNKFLKENLGTFLDPIIGPGNFPSGHMQTAIVFWFYLVWESDRKLYKVLSITYCLAVAFSLFYLKYHTVNDIIVAWAFGILSVWIMRKIAYLNVFTKKEYYLPIFLGLLSLSIMFLLQKNYPHLWIPIGSFCGFIIGFYTREKKKIDNVYLGFDMPKPLIIISIVVGILSIYGTVSLIGLLPFLNTHFTNFLKFTWIAYWISCGSDIYLQQLIEKIREQHRLKQQQTL